MDATYDRLCNRREYISCYGQGCKRINIYSIKQRQKTFKILFIHLTKSLRVWWIGHMTLIYHVLLSRVPPVEPEQWVSEWVNLRPTVSRPVCPGVRRPSRTCDQFFFLLEISFRHLRFYKFVAPFLTRGRVWKLLYNCFRALPEQSLLSRSPAELTALFYCLIWDSINLEARSPYFEVTLVQGKSFNITIGRAAWEQGAQRVYLYQYKVAIDNQSTYNDFMIVCSHAH
jgi:hypothetical protein